MKRIALFDAKPNMVVGRDVRSRTGHLLLKKGAILSEKNIGMLARYGVPIIYIEDNLSDSSESLAPVNEVPDVINWETRVRAERVVQNIFRDVKMGNVINLARPKKVVDEIINELLENANIIGKLSDIRILDDYTFAHSVNVCVLAISIGIALNYSRLRLRELGIGALLHDIGKTKVPDRILLKPANLTNEEFEEIKKHPIYGYELLNNHPDLSSNSARICLQHHERINGAGYPYKFKGAEIHEYSKIVSIADVYDALTADRVYKNAVYPYEAIEVIIASSGNHFDPDLVRLFVENISIYPVGSTVLLNTGETAVVTQVHRSFPIRPVVKLLTTADGKPVKDLKELDLMTNTTLFINKVLDFKNTKRQ
ncbi:HD-GYP domain-containing protein [Thermincola potens]|uniref:Metal dependent phosphohydrolase n=1 Tax=Thermincola potens (strain JR) TaxID=635013 RepID=D5X8K8_THEPJ|nr:HD-GYP domain-containing protein [Thermincola potens]ADG82884.1 metal dependent phosphohydrolase [Thermincola potens JR]